MAKRVSMLGNQNARRLDEVRKSERLSFRVTKDLKEKVAFNAAKNGMNIGDYARCLIEKGLK